MKVKRIYRGNDGGKEWVAVTFEQSYNGDLKWLPKLEDIAWIARLIAEVEDMKYDSPKLKGGEMVREYVNRAIDGDNVLMLSEEFRIPNIGSEEKFKPYNASDE